MDIFPLTPFSVFGYSPGSGGHKTQNVSFPLPGETPEGPQSEAPGDPKTRMEEEIICNRWKDLADECRLEPNARSFLQPVGWAVTRISSHLVLHWSPTNQALGSPWDDS